MSKYDWSNVPKEINWIATDGNGRKYGYIDYEPFLNGWIPCWESFNESIPLGYMGCDLEGCKGWSDSLEERPK